MIAAREFCRHVMHCNVQGLQHRWNAPGTQAVPLIIRLWSCAARACPTPRAARWRGVVSSAAASSSSTASEVQGTGHKKRKIVFMGTPEVAALVLRKLLDAAAAPDASFEVAAVVSQPARPRGRKRLLQPSPVQALAAEAGLPPDRVLCPEKASDSAFLDTLRTLRPDLCVTAAYGLYLPTSLLAIPPCGVLNIHPSLLPQYRGAAPVQRSLQSGVTQSGVSLLYTVKAMDAGPVLAQRTVEVCPDIQAPELLEQLFSLGTQLLLDSLAAVWDGTAPATAWPQDEAAATHAAKLSREEAAMDFQQPAAVLHNKVRAFAGWPGTYHVFRLHGGVAAAGSDGDGQKHPDAHGDGEGEVVELKVVRTRVVPAHESPFDSGSDPRALIATRQGLYVRCGDSCVLELVEVQPPGKKVMAGTNYANGLKGRTLRWQPAIELLVPAVAPA